VTAVVRCAVYTRQSVEERGKNGFGSLEAQREAAEKYISLYPEKRWQLIPTKYEDSGISGGTLDRPALTRLRSDIASGEIDCVVVYRSDRLSRSIRDFLELMEEFDKHRAAFVSVSEQFDTSTPGGRMHRNMLLTFAQYERELIAERTRDKVHAARRRGKFIGGLLPLGYDRDPKGGRLVVNKTESERVREIFRLFIACPSVVETVQELNRHGWTLKRWKTKAGGMFGGGSFDVYSLRRLLTNPVYVGKVIFEGNTYDAEHDPIVDRQTWDGVQALLTAPQARRRYPSTRSTALRAGLMRCAACGCAMTPTFSSKGRVRYRYYLCNKAHRRGWSTCPSPSIPAVEIERFVVDQIRAIGRDPDLIARTVQEAGRLLTARKTDLDAEARRLQKDLESAHRTLRDAIRPAGGNGNPRRRSGSLADQEAAIQALEDRLGAVQGEQEALRAQRIAPDDLRAALASFDPVWEHLTTAEKTRVVQLLIERIDYDGGTGKLALTFRPTGVRTLATDGAPVAEAAP
jgi:site-specific DNA recombinase